MVSVKSDALAPPRAKVKFIGKPPSFSSVTALAALGTPSGLRAEILRGAEESEELTDLRRDQELVGCDGAHGRAALDPLIVEVLSSPSVAKA